MLLFGFVFAIPGYVAGWVLNLFDFRQRLPATRLVIANVLSMAISPILAFLAYRFGSARVAFVMLAAFTVAFAVILLRAKRLAIRGDMRPYLRIALFAAAGWTIVAILSLTDIQFGNRLYYNSVSYDFTTRVALINAITRSGVPPANASWFPGHAVPLTYVYYFWYVPCSLVAQLGGSLVNAHAVMVASVAWCGLALMSVIALYLRLRNPASGAGAWRSALVGCALVTVSGLDIVAILGRPGILVPYHGDLEHWNEQITAWVGALSWVPHHVAAVIACVAGILLVQWMRGRSLSTQIKATVIAGLAFASGVGLSVFVTMVFAVAWGIWLLWLLVHQERRTAALMAAAGIIAVVAASPFLLGLVGTSGSSGGALPLVLDIRPFDAIMPFVGGFPQPILKVIFLLLLPVNYLIELGFFFVAALFWMQRNGKGRWQQNPYHVAEVMLLGVTVFVGSFIRSTVIGSNDLGWRAWLPGQFVLLIWGVDVLAATFPSGLLATKFESRESRLLGTEMKALLLIGLLTSVADVVFLRAWPMLEDAGIASSVSRQCVDTQQGWRTYSAHQAYDFVNASTPANAVIEANPSNLLNIPEGLYANRQIAVSAHTAYGVPEAALLDRASRVGNIFQATSWNAIDAACKQYSIDVLVTSDLDPIWESLPSLEQQRKPLYQNGYYAVFGCGNYLDP